MTHVLFAEDDPQIAGPVMRAFERAGLRARWVTRGDDAQAALAAGAFDAAVLDIGLPGCDGLEVLRRLRERGDPLPVLLLTARDEVGDRVRGLDAGADDYLVKPFDMVELEARVRALLRRGRVAGGPPAPRLGRLSLRGDETGPRLDDLPLIADWPNRPLQMVDHAIGKPSRTRLRVVGHEPWLDATRVDLFPETGRSHQLRVHLQAIGYPILGDEFYAPPEVFARATRLLLHATVLAFRHPSTATALRVESPAPF